MNYAEESKWLTIKEAAKYCRISVGYLHELRSRNKGPRECRIGRRVLYNIQDLDAWINGSKR